MPVSHNVLHPANFLWVAGIMAFPFYVFSSGTVQISTLLWTLAAVIELSRVQPSVLARSARFLRPLAAFLLVVVVIQSVWAIFTSDADMLTYVAYYLFNGLVLVAVVSRISTDPEFCKLLGRAIFASLVLQVVLSLTIARGEALRGALFFNNPNQLGYFALSFACLLTVLRKVGMTSTGTFAVGMLCSGWLSQIALSKSAMVATSILLLYVAFESPRVLLVLLVVTVVASLDAFQGERVQLIVDRLTAIGDDSDDSLEGRGYDRLWMHPEMMLWGAGEGAFYRWQSFLSTTEMHSSWGTVLFSYGVVGTLFFLLLNFRAGISLGLTSAVPLGVLYAYGIAHNGLRFTPMWLLLAVVIGLAFWRSRESRPAAVLQSRPYAMPDRGTLREKSL